MLYCSFFKAFPINILGLYGWLLRTSFGDDVQRKIWLLSFCVNIWLALYHGFLCYLSSDASGQVDKEIRLKISGKWHRKYSFVIDQAQKRTRPSLEQTEQVWSKKDLLTLSPGLFPSLGKRLRIYYMAKKRTFSCGTTAGNPWTGSQLERRIRFILPLVDFAT